MAKKPGVKRNGKPLTWGADGSKAHRFAPIDAAYDTKLRMVSRGDFSEAEIQEMEAEYGAPIRRPAVRPP